MAESNATTRRFPKPPRRGPKPRKRIARGKAPKRGKRISRRPKAPRRKADRYAMSLWSSIVRRRSATCVSPVLGPWRDRREYVPCGKPTTQAAHGYDRADMGTRFDLRNGFPSCYSCNCLVYQRRKRLWFEWVEQQWGAELTAEMRAKANAPGKVDLAAVLTALEAVLHGEMAGKALGKITRFAA